MLSFPNVALGALRQPTQLNLVYSVLLNQIINSIKNRIGRILEQQFDHRIIPPYNKFVDIAITPGINPIVKVLRLKPKPWATNPPKLNNPRNMQQMQIMPIIQRIYLLMGLATDK
ncbi:hypothetical protein [uncultured Nostoc sp.]|uniref:hypothetical protein n=1 Tax=uncultured Nostoc sp. TaxID=340711 RepID=UPI0035CBA40A